MNPSGLSDKAEEIVTTRTQWWQCALFAQAICDEIAQQRRVAWKPQSYIEVVFEMDTLPSWNEYEAWGLSQTNEMKDLMTLFSNLLATNQDAFLTPGQNEDPDKIVQIARRVGDLYAKALSYQRELRRHRWEVSPSFRWDASLSTRDSELLPPVGPFIPILTACVAKIRDTLIYNAKVIVRFYEDYGPEVLRRIEESLSKKIPGEGHFLDLTMRFNIVVDIDDEINRLNAFLQQLRAEVVQLTAEAEKEQARLLSLQNLNAGYLYLLMNPSMPGIIKIGKTTRTPDERAKELGAATGVPTAFVVVFEILVDNCHRAEQYVHERLENYRISGNREFFKMASSAAINVMLDAKVYCQTAPPEPHYETTYLCKCKIGNEFKDISSKDLQEFVSAVEKVKFAFPNLKMDFFEVKEWIK